MAGRASVGIVGQIVSSTLQIGLAIAILVIVRQDLFFGVAIAGPFTTTFVTTCWLSTDGYSTICNYAYSLAAISLVVAVMAVVGACIPAGRGAGAACGNLFLAIWMLAGAIVITIHGNDANDAGYPQESYRNAVIGLCWASFALAILTLIGNVLMLARSKKREDSAAAGAYDDGMTKPSAYDAEQPPSASPAPHSAYPEP